MRTDGPLPEVICYLENILIDGHVMLIGGLALNIAWFLAFVVTQTRFRSTDTYFLILETVLPHIKHNTQFCW